MPAKFATAVMKGGKISVKLSDDGLLRSYRRALLREVVDTESKVLREGFVVGRNLSCAAEHFRDELWLRYLSLPVAEDAKSDEESFKCFLKERTIDVDDLGGDGSHIEEGIRGSPKSLAKHFARLIEENKDSKLVRVDEDDTKVLDSLDYMLDFVLMQNGNKYSFRPGFFPNGWMPKNLLDFKESLKARAKNSGLEFEELEKYTFEVENHSPLGVPHRYDGDRLELDVREFLEKLTFALRQPGIEEMEESIRQEMAECLNVVDASDAYGRYFNAMYSWAESRDARFMVERDLKEFFDERKKEMVGCIRFNLRDPVVDFVGREKQLKGILEFLQEDSCAKKGRSTPQSLIISGLGGMGKSEMARQYAKRNYISVYNNIVWISAENNESLERSFTTLAFQRLGIKRETHDGEMKDVEVVVQEVYNFFRGKKTLFIFDNVEVSSHLRRFFPGAHGNKETHVLVTSRCQDWRGFQILSLENFSPDEAYSFIEMSIGDIATFAEDHGRELAKSLSFFPLALKQAVSFIEEKVNRMKFVGRSFSIPDYLKLLRVKMDKLLNYPLPEELLNDYSLTTFKTMSIAVEHVKKSKHGKIAINVLNTMSYLSPDNIDTNILSFEYPEYTAEQFGSALDMLSNLSIMSFEKSNARIHRLIQLVNQVSLRNSGEEERVLSDCFHTCVLMDVEHKIVVWESACQYRGLVRKNASRPLVIIAELSNKSMWKAAMEFGEKAIGVLNHHLGSEHMNTLITRRGYARSFYYAGKCQEAAKLQEELICDFRRIFGDRDVELFEAMYHYGVSILQLGKLEESLEVFTEILEKGKSIIDDKLYPTKIKIVEVLRLLGRHEETEDLRKEIDSSSTNILEHYERSRNECGLDERVLNSLGDAEKRDRCLRLHNLAMTKMGLVGNCDIDTVVQAKMALAKSRSLDGQWEDALIQLQSAFELLMERYGVEHLKTRDSAIQIAGALLKLGRFEQALQIVEKELELQGQGFPTNSMISTAKVKMVEALVALHRYEDAVPYIAESVVSDPDPSPASVESALKLILQLLSSLIQSQKYEDGMKILTHWFNLLEKHKGSKSEYLDAILGLASLLRSRGRAKDCLEVLKSVYGLLKSTEGEHDIRTLNAKYFFANVYCELGKPSALRKGLKYMSELHEVLCSKVHDGECAEVLTLLGGVTNDIHTHGSEEEASRTAKKTYNKALVVLGPNHLFTGASLEFLQSLGKIE